MNDHSYPVFKGLGRKATFMGVPTRLLLGAFAVVAMIAMTAGLAWWGLVFVVMPTLAILTRDDDKPWTCSGLSSKLANATVISASGRVPATPCTATTGAAPGAHSSDKGRHHD